MSETNYARINDYGAVRLSLASPQDIRSWSYGEVKKPDLIDHSSGRPQKGGLFCEKIFGTENDWECSCGKYRGTNYEGTVCDCCGVKVSHSRARGERMGHIELAAPVVHPWYLKANPSRIGAILGMKRCTLEKVIYFRDRIIVDAGLTPLRERQLLSEWEHQKAREYYGDDFEADIGAEAIKKLLERADVRELARQLREQLHKKMYPQHGAPSRRAAWNLIRRLKVIEALRDSGTDGPDSRPEWMVLDCIPVIPPGLRPLVRLPEGRFAVSSLNDLYRRVISRNNRLIKLVNLNAVDCIIRNEKLQLQLAVDALFGSGRSSSPLLGSLERPTKPLTARGIPRQRPAVVPGPELKLHQCGLPRAMALGLFRPLVVRRLLELGLAESAEAAGEMVEREDGAAWRVLEEVAPCHRVLLSPGPASPRPNIQAFEPVLVDGDAIRVHPLACAGAGPDLAVYLPLSTEAQAEAAVLMAPANNVFSPANGLPAIRPTQDVVLGCYYLTAEGGQGEPGEGMAFASPEEVLTAWGQGKLGTHARIRVRLPAGRPDGGRLVSTTVGRVLFNDALGPKMPFYDTAMTAEQLARVISDCHAILGRRETAELLDRLKQLGFREATRSGLSLATGDLLVPPSKSAVLAQTRRNVDAIQRGHDEGNFCESERRNTTIDLWDRARHAVTEAMTRGLQEDQAGLNPLRLVAHSGAQEGDEYLRHLCGMRGLVADPGGRIIEAPITSNLREGLGVLEYFFWARAARRGLAGDALAPSAVSQLTRKLADLAQNVVVTLHDCGTNLGVSKLAGEALRGRVLLHDVINPISGERVGSANELLTAEAARRIEGLGFDKALVRSPMTCKAPRGVCRLCYGMDLAAGALVELGSPVGIIAALSLGAIGTAPEAPPSLDRLVELFEARTPRRPAVLAELGGIVRVGEKKRGKRSIFILPTDEHGQAIPWAGEREHVVPANRPPCVQPGQHVKAGDPLADGPRILHDVLDIEGPAALQHYLVDEARKAYRALRVDVDDKHVEIVVARMMATVQVRDGGDAGLLPGSQIARDEFIRINERLAAEFVKIKAPGASTRFKADDVVKKEDYEQERARLEDAGKDAPTRTKPQKATMKVLLLGLTEAALATESFLGALSFPGGLRALIDAALRGAADRLEGMKQHALLGRLIPAGTGFQAPR